MGDALNGVFNRMREGVQRIDAPSIARAVVRNMADAVNHRVAQVEVGALHVDFRPQHMRALGKFARLHAQEQIHVFFRAAAAERTILAGLGQRATAGADFVCRLRVHIGFTGANQRAGAFKHFFKVIRGIADFARPLKT